MRACEQGWPYLSAGLDAPAIRDFRTHVRGRTCALCARRLELEVLAAASGTRGSASSTGSGPGGPLPGGSGIGAQLFSTLGNDDKKATFTVFSAHRSTYSELSPGCRSCRSCRTTVGPLSDHCRTSHCRTAGLLSVSLSEHCRSCRSVIMIPPCRTYCRTVGCIVGRRGARRRRGALELRLALEVPR